MPRIQYLLQEGRVLGVIAGERPFALLGSRSRKWRRWLPLVLLVLLEILRRLL